MAVLLVGIGLSAAACGAGAALGRLPVIGEPAGTPPAPAVTPDPPPLQQRRDIPSRAMSPSERAAREADLAAARANAAAERRKQIQESQ